MDSIRDNINMIQKLKLENQEAENYIFNLKKEYNEKIANSMGKITINKEKIMTLETKEFFVNVKDIIEEFAKGEGNINDLNIQIIGTKKFRADVDDETIRKLMPNYSIGEFRLYITFKQCTHKIKFAVKIDDIQLDGKPFVEHLIAKSQDGYTIMSVDNYEDIVIRYNFDDIFLITKDSVCYRNSISQLIYNAILTRELRRKDELSYKSIDEKDGEYDENEEN